MSALDYQGKWGPTYSLSNPCKIGQVCTVWCIYKSGTFVGNYTAMVNVTNSFYSRNEYAMSVIIRLPANGKKYEQEHENNELIEQI